MKVPPRIRGKVGQATEGPPELIGKWFFELWLTQIGGGEGYSLGQFGPWESERQALAELRKACQLACESVEKDLTGKISGKYIDMKTNEVRTWENH